MTDWESMWSRNGGLKPNTAFDIGGITPTLQKLADEGVIVAGKSYVPGCGRGWDVTLNRRSISPDHSCLGFDIAPTAVEAAEARRDADTQVPAERAGFTTQDWFHASQPSGGGYVFGYDYTFLCASLRERGDVCCILHFKARAAP